MEGVGSGCCLVEIHRQRERERQIEGGREREGERGGDVGYGS